MFATASFIALGVLAAPGEVALGTQEAATRVAVLPVQAEFERSAGFDAIRGEALQALIAQRLAHDNYEVVLLEADDPAGECSDGACLQRTLGGRGVTHALRVRLGGEVRMYDVELEIYDASTGTMLTENSDSCSVCGWSDLQDVVATSVDPLRGWLALAATQPAKAQASPPRPTVRAGRRSRTSRDPSRGGQKPWMRPVAIGAIALGAAATTAGIALLSLHGREDLRRCDGPGQVDDDGDCRYVHQTLAPGVVSLVAGVGLSAAGITVLGIGSRGAQLSLGATHRKVVLSGRF